ncbi:MAG: hypothetical protein HY832_00440 [Candidatus Aenigmarchaeota archaeon]|nr:hypothetical protein [Candidatus Aenigmarchaeota archaeon]MBI5061731.1 hypothetical protein [Candidatus Aenigmarchaeota archaeon]
MNLFIFRRWKKEKPETAEKPPKNLYFDSKALEQLWEKNISDGPYRDQRNQENLEQPVVETQNPYLLYQH